MPHVNAESDMMQQDTPHHSYCGFVGSVTVQSGRLELTFWFSCNTEWL